MNAVNSRKDRLNRWKYFFPFQLLLLHFKKNHLLLFIWTLLFAIASGVVAKNFGVPQQFLIPEYRGASGFISFAIVGFSVGGFITGFNLYTYIMHGYRFPLIATLSRPFQKFSLNNFLLPALFLITYTWCSARFQLEKELIPPVKVCLNILSFFIGLTAFQGLSYLYFKYTNKDAKHFGQGRKRNGSNQTKEEKESENPAPWWKFVIKVRKWHVETYMSSWKKISLAREGHHYSKEVLEKVFTQNHINASRFEVVLVISFLLVGSLRSFELFIIPAAASAMLLFTMIIMLISALHSWLKGWTFTLFVVILVVLNFFYTDLRWIRLENHASGLNYDTYKAPYDLASLSPDSTLYNKDVASSLEILERWKKQISNGANDSLQKPKLVIINCSGGGTRSAYWTMKSLAYADSIMNGRLLDHTVLMTGASGGMFGAAFIRELRLRKAYGEDVNIYNPTYAETMAQDLLNPIILSIASNDWFIRYQKSHDGDYTYTKDRAFAFEEQLERNTGSIFNRRLRDYAQPEKDAIVPMLILSPTIVNDGRRLIISSQPVSYLTQAYHMNGNKLALPEDVEFSRLFEKQDAGNLKYASALRMNATFPYILPIATLPSDPPIELMDAGIRDNFGLKTTLQYLFTFKDWINENTSGVIILQIRDLPKNKNLSDDSRTLFGNFSAPVGSIYGNMTKTHDYNHEQMLRYELAWFEKNIQLVTFELAQEKESVISLSWHLTKAEKNHIRNATSDLYFKEEFNRLQAIFNSR